MPWKRYVVYRFNLTLECVLCLEYHLVFGTEASSVRKKHLYGRVFHSDESSVWKSLPYTRIFCAEPSKDGADQGGLGVNPNHWIVISVDSNISWGLSVCCSRCGLLKGVNTPKSNNCCPSGPNAWNIVITILISAWSVLPLTCEVTVIQMVSSRTCETAQ